MMQKIQAFGRCLKMNKILNRSQVYRIKPKEHQFSPKAYVTLNQELENIVKNTLNFAITTAEQNDRTTIRSSDIKNGLNEYLESYGSVYLKLLKDAMFSELKLFFEEKEKVVRENASRRFDYKRIEKKE
jgi:histone H3/H4